jgi:DNA helicase-2/ATP-dependent DNA helicase PcrA
MQSDDKIWHLDVLRCVMDFAKEETLRNPHHDLTSFTTLLDEMEEQEIKFNLQRSYGNELGVNLLTAHSAKGLEFQYVFIVNAIAAAWERKDAKSDGYTIPDTILMSNQSSKESLIEEKRRLFFVAMTRAEEHLHISWSKTDSKLKVSEPSMFIAEIIEKTNWHQQKITLSENDVIDYLQIHLLKDKQPVLPDLEFDFVNKIVDRFEMNVTALNNYLNCPLRFYYNNILRIPSGRSEASTFGSAVHHALERYFKKMRDNENEFLPKEDLSNDFVWYMQRNRAAFTPEALKRRLEYGQQILSDFYDHNIDTWSKIVSVEHMFTNIVVDGVPLKGKLDKLEFDFRNVTIVDYKTGNPSKSNDKLAPPTAKKPLGGDYWRQAVFYKLLVDNNKQKDWHAIQTTFQFVEPSDNDTYENVIIMPSEDDLQTVRNQIQDTWQKIQQHDFYKGCGDGNCTYCNFTKDNKLYVKLVEGVDEKNE